MPHAYRYISKKFTYLTSDQLAVWKELGASESFSQDKSTSFGRNRWIIVIAAALAAALVLSVYATSLLTVNNTATIKTGASLVGTGPVPPGTTCAATTGTYSGSFPLDWGTVPTGLTTSQFICIENTGSGNYQVSVTTSLPGADGSVSTPQSGNLLGPSNFLLVELDWQVLPGATLGPVAFTINFQ